MLCNKETVFGFLKAGRYWLKFRRNKQVAHYLFELPSGSYVTVSYDFSKQSIRWTRDLFHCFFNLP